MGLRRKLGFNKEPSTPPPPPPPLPRPEPVRSDLVPGLFAPTTIPAGPPDGWLWRADPSRPWTWRLSLDGRSYPKRAQFRAVRFDGPPRYFTDETRPTDA